MVDMSNDLCSPYQCNICLMLKTYDEGSNSNLPVTETFLITLNCSGCHLVKYCSVEHQKIDWPIHKPFCNAIQKIKKEHNLKHPFQVNGQLCKKEDVENSIVQLKYLLRNILGRNLEYQEEELTSFPAYCPLCFKFKNLKAFCCICFSQAYCSEEHKQQHSIEHEKVCNHLQTYYCPYKIQTIKNDFCTDFQSELNTLENVDLVKAFEKIFALKLAKQPCQDQKSYQLFSHAADFSCIMTICFAIQLLKVNTKDMEKFKILVLGASIEPVLWFKETHCKLFFLLNPKIMELNIEFIGPEVVETVNKNIKFHFKVIWYSNICVFIFKKFSSFSGLETFS